MGLLAQMAAVVPLRSNADDNNGCTMAQSHPVTVIAVPANQYIESSTSAA